MDNPFVYAKPVPPEDLVDREQEAKQLLELVRAGHNCRLSAPRRYGKTSLIQKIRQDAGLGGNATVYVNFYGILATEDAVARLERGYREVRGPLARWVTGKLASMNVAVTTPVGGVAFGGAGQRDANRHLLELLELPRQLFQRNGQRVIVCFDEFQEVLSPRTALDGAIRSVIEQHHDEAGYLFAGSHPGMMRALFEDRERPFYGQARSISLEPLAGPDLAEYIGARFERTGRDVGDALRPLIELCRGHPQRAMQVAHFVWERTPSRGTADEGTFAEALELVFQDLAEAFDRAWRGFDDGERRTLVAVVLSGGRPRGQRVMETVEVPRTTVTKALVRLEAAGHVVDVDGTWQLVDPLFARWIAQGRLEP